MHNILIDVVQRVGRTGMRRDKKKTTFTKSYKGQEIDKSHDQPYPEGTWYIEKKCVCVLFY